MSNTERWLKSIDELVAIVDSARHSIPMDEMFEDEQLYYPVKDVVSEFDMASWLMFDTLENRETTTRLIRQFWRHLHKMKGMDPYLRALFSSYLSIYRVNRVAEAGIYVQDLIFREHAKIIEKTEMTRSLKEEDIFFGRLLQTEEGNFAFYIANIVPEDLRENFREKVAEMLEMQTHLLRDPEAYRQSLKDGNPDLMFVYALGIERAREIEQDDFIGEIYEEDEMWGQDDFEHWIGEVKDTTEISVEDGYLLEKLESDAMEIYGSDFDEAFSDYDSLFARASEEGDFSDDAQMLRTVKWFEHLVKDGDNKEAKEAMERVKSRLMMYRANLVRTVGGFYRAKDLDRAVEATEIDSPFIERYDRYLYAFVEGEIERTRTGAVNRKSLEVLLPAIGIAAEEAEHKREGSFPELVLFRKFAELKGLIMRQEKGYDATIRMDRYLHLDPKKKLSLWLSTLLHPELRAADPYFEAWPVARGWSRFTDHRYIERLIEGPPDENFSKIEGSIVRMGHEMGIFELDYNGRYYADMSPIGERVLARSKIEERDNITPLFGE